MRKYLIVLLLLVTARIGSAQTVVADRLRLPGPCVITGVDGSPDKIVISGSCTTITTDAATNLTIAPTGDIVLGPAGNDILPNTPYTQNLGALFNKYLTLHAAELWVETLVAQNTIATIGGRVLVAPTNILEADLGTGGTSISVKYNNFNNGDRIYMEASAKVEFMAVSSSASGSGPYTYSVTRNLDGSGANQWYAGDAILDTGTTGNGFIDLYSTAGVLSTGAGPTIVGNVRTGTTYNAYAPRWAIGNLNGLYNYGADTYGTAFGDPSATNITVDATNGIRIRNGTTNKLTADTSGNLSIVGDLTVGTSGTIRSGATAYGTGTGWWMEYNAGTPRFRIGNPSGNQLTWDGTTLTVSGVGTGLTAISGGNITTGSITATQIAANTITAAKIAAGTITATEIAATTITAAKIAANTITASQIASATITATQIASGTITATQIAAGTITADRLSVSTLSAISADIGSITAGSIAFSGGGGRTTFMDGDNLFASVFDADFASIGDATISSAEIVSLTIPGLGGGDGYVCVGSSGNLYRATSCP